MKLGNFIYYTYKYLFCCAFLFCYAFLVFDCLSDTNRRKVEERRFNLNLQTATNTSAHQDVNLSKRCSGYQPSGSCLRGVAGYRCPDHDGKCMRSTHKKSCAFPESGEWSSESQKCKWFRIFWGKNIIIVGDSMMRQTFTALIAVFRDNSIIIDYNLWKCGFYTLHYSTSSTESQRKRLFDTLLLTEILKNDKYLCKNIPQEFPIIDGISILYLPAATYLQQHRVLQHEISRMKLNEEKSIFLFSHQMHELLNIKSFESNIINSLPSKLCIEFESFFARTKFVKENLFIIGTPYQHIPTKLAAKIAMTRDLVMKNWAELFGANYIDHDNIAKKKKIQPLKLNNWHHQCYLKRDRTKQKVLAVFGRANNAKCNDLVNSAILYEITKKIMGREV
ncbi:unknown protein [Bathycoccus prasinos]|uniref:Uncharacterized protein n=1 Tax=Bathycoccus prasinos TaxID=41875 RepID=K8F7K7_9CHLO|nr:unknown protein [Bathycoccus prasinos]CCO20810.1 unknown protein [Bathycoccus prasinos]|eukprot:XP_007508091.1 unknown protein [Bathycoccus prasinos]